MRKLRKHARENSYAAFFSSRLRLALVGMVLCTLNGCLKRIPIATLPNPTHVMTAIVRDDVYQRSTYLVSTDVASAVRTQLVKRNLVVKTPEEQALLAAFSQQRETQARLDWLRAHSDNAEYVLLIESKTAFYSQLNGRYKWLVSYKVTFGPSEKNGSSTSESFELPAILSFDHERDEAALISVANTVAKQLAALIDTALPNLASRSVSSLNHSSPIAEATSLETIYFILVDRFHNGDRQNDGVVDLAEANAWHGGDLKGILDKLDYLQSLGVKTLWLSPIFKSRQHPFGEQGAFHGYWTEDLRQIDTRFGGTDDLARLSRELHRRKMQLLLDLVVNHVGYDAPLVSTHPEWFHRKGDIQNWNDPQEVIEHDVHGLPDLAQEREPVYRYLFEGATRWIANPFHVDGFRLDAVKHVSWNFWRRFHRDLRQHASNLILLGEHYHGNPNDVATVKRQGEFSHIFDFPLAYALRDVFCKSEDVAAIGVVLSNDRLYDHADALVTFVDNHDLPRLRTLCANDTERIRSALTALFALRGIPSITYGTETGLQGEREPENRSDMNFSPSTEHDLRRELAELIKLRRSDTALREGHTHLLNYRDQTLELLRIANHQAAWIVFNGSDRELHAAPPRRLARGEFRDARSHRTVNNGVMISPRSLAIALFEPNLARIKPFTEPLPRRKVTFILDTSTTSATETHLVGSGPELGNWSAPNAHAFRNRSDDQTKLELELPTQHLFAYKLVVRSPDGKIVWEAGDNRYLFVTSDTNPLTIHVSFRAEG